NKVYLAELLERNNVPTPRTLVVHKDNVKELQQTFNYPIILKSPDSCLSQGVVKAKDEEGLKKILKDFFGKSDLIIAQEFMPTEYDWRIGIIDGEPFFACKYYMTGGHWQITEWNDQGETNDGDHLTVPVSAVPSAVLEVALQAAKLIGNGLYGVDVKEVDGKPFVMEVNDNPNIDYGVEDQVDGVKIYSTIMSVFLKRLDQNKAVAQSNALSK
ncbi:MAG: RimK family alpha-L-glutamate ligase, partial [Bacteroidota bacterium]|nr:RimK family alpha-L-glutamate ligase [Bacteroidota bacterium]